MRTRREVRADIAVLEYKLGNFEIDPDAMTEEHKGMLRERYGNQEGCIELGEHLHYDVPFALDPIDPVAYRLFDYLRSLNPEDAPSYKALAEELDELRDELLDLEQGRAARESSRKEADNANA